MIIFSYQDATNMKEAGTISVASGLSGVMKLDEGHVLTARPCYRDMWTPTGA